MPKSRRSITAAVVARGFGGVAVGAQRFQAMEQGQPAGFLAEVDDGTASGVLDDAEGGLEFLAAGGEGGTENVAEEMLGMHADEDGLGMGDGVSGGGVEVADAAAAEGDVEEGIADGFVDAQVEVAEGGVEGQGFEAFDEGVAFAGGTG